jgi:endonuclease YncB( thermonuclease family)
VSAVAAASLLTFIWLLAPGAARAAEPQRIGPIAAEVLGVHDGDTFRARAAIWPGISADTAVRLRGIDAPELAGKCPAERAAAIAARQALAALLGARVTLLEIAPDKYGGRIDARVLNAAGLDVGAAMIAAGHARPYDGRARGGWC